MHATDGAGADCTIMRKWKLLFVNGCECKRQISTAAVFFFLGGGFKNRDCSLAQTRCT